MTYIWNIIAYQTNYTFSKQFSTQGPDRLGDMLPDTR